MTEKTTQKSEQKQVQKRYQKEMTLYQKQIKKNKAIFGGGKAA